MFPNLQKVNLAYCKNITREGLDCLALLPNLMELDLRKTDIDCDTVRDIITNCPQLQKLQLSEQDDSESIKFLASVQDIIESAPSLHMEAQGGNITILFMAKSAEQIKDLDKKRNAFFSKFLRKHSGNVDAIPAYLNSLLVQVTELDCNGLTQEQLKKIVEKFPNLQKIDIGFSAIPADYISLIQEKVTVIHSPSPLKTIIDSLLQQPPCYQMLDTHRIVSLDRLNSDLLERMSQFLDVRSQTLIRLNKRMRRI
jgi:hypothetical protein